MSLIYRYVTSDHQLHSKAREAAVYTRQGGLWKSESTATQRQEVNAVKQFLSKVDDIYPRTIWAQDADIPVRCFLNIVEVESKR